MIHDLGFSSCVVHMDEHNVVLDLGLVKVGWWNWWVCVCFFYGFHGCGYHLCLLFLVWVLCVVNLNLGCIVALGKHCQIWKKKATSTFDRFGKFGADIGGIYWVRGKSRSTQENRCGVFFFLGPWSIYSAFM